MNEPRWLPRLAVEAAHMDHLREHGGLPGVREETALESALARPRQKFAYEADADLCLLAASYGFGLARNHAFNDENKRIAFLSMAMFLGMNGHSIETSELDVVQTILSLAGGEMDESALAAWLRTRTVRTLPRRQTRHRTER